MEPKRPRFTEWAEAYRQLSQLDAMADEVAAAGSRNVMEAVVAYGMLREEHIASLENTVREKNAYIHELEAAVASGQGYIESLDKELVEFRKKRITREAKKLHRKQVAAEFAAAHPVKKDRFRRHAEEASRAKAELNTLKKEWQKQQAQAAEAYTLKKEWQKEQAEEELKRALEDLEVQKEKNFWCDNRIDRLKALVPPPLCIPIPPHHPSLPFPSPSRLRLAWPCGLIY